MSKYHHIFNLCFRIRSKSMNVTSQQIYQTIINETDPLSDHCSSDEADNGYFNTKFDFVQKGDSPAEEIKKSPFSYDFKDNNPFDNSQDGLPTPKFGHIIRKSEIDSENDYNLKFIFKNDKEKAKFI